ncbi:MAG: PQQ-dependent sugar dehydrogenase [Leeuwenhoekiella sp.]
MKKSLLSLFVYFITAIIYSQELGIEPFATGFTRPLNIQHAGDDRLFVVEQGGLIKIVESDGNVIEEPYLDISGLVSTGGERGLLGLVFHPDYTANGLFYVNYTDSAGSTQVSRFTVSENDANVALANSEIKMINLEQPFSNHNGGCLAFGPDGFLYIGLGDGGSSGDPGNRAQDTSSLYGSLLRIDVDGALPYAIPADNPFVNDNSQQDEIWAFGLRNPWKFSFDSETGDLWLADVGQNAFEEINRVAFDIAGVNYGWRCYEANNLYNNAIDCPDQDDITFPINAYPHTNNRASITGGYVYRGTEFPGLQNNYIFADFVSNELGSIDASGNDDQITFTGPFPNTGFSSFGIDNNNELYVAGLISGTIYKVVDTDALSLEPVTERKATFYPNPSSDILNISIVDASEKIKLTIFDILGKRIFEMDLTTGKSQINTSSFKKGVYFVQFESNNSASFTDKLIIE